MVLPEGESGLQKFNLTEERASLLSSWFACPSSMKDETIGRNEIELAKKLGVTSKWLREVKQRPEMQAQVREKLHAAAVYGMPNILYKAIQMAEEGDLKATRFVGEISGLIKQHGIQVNNNVISPTVTEELSDEAIIMAVERIASRRIEPKGDDAP